MTNDRTFYVGPEGQRQEIDGFAMAFETSQPLPVRTGVSLPLPVEIAGQERETKKSEKFETVKSVLYFAKVFTLDLRDAFRGRLSQSNKEQTFIQTDEDFDRSISGDTH